jgi:REP element-mobilizing transposase RayT
MSKPKQTSFFKSQGIHQFCHGGILRNKRKGRGRRPLSTKESLHCVFKINSSKLKLRGLRAHQSFQLIHQILWQYAGHFYIKVEQVSVQNNHIHLLIRTSRRSQFHYFFRVFAGQIAQRFESKGWLVTDTLTKPQKGTRLWSYRPFSRVVRGWKAYQTVRDYIQLNEKEATGEIRYKKSRLKGLSAGEWEILWA